MHHAFKAYQDALALERGKHVLRLYPEAKVCSATGMACLRRELGPFPGLEEHPVLSVKGFVEDLERRKKAGRFGRKWSFPPPGYAGWPVRRQIAYLIDILEDIPPNHPSPVESVESMKHVFALVEKGDAAVPALLAVVENDTRITRGAQPVREAAFHALKGILRTDAVLGDVAFNVDKEAPARLRAYWKKYGHLPLHKRLLLRLTDVKAGPDAWRLSAWELGRLGMVFEPDWGKPYQGANAGDPRVVDQEGVWRCVRANPALALPRPTVAEAILAAMDRDQTAVPERWPCFEPFEPDDYLDALARLGDKRIVPELHKRLKRATGAERRRLADVCRRLGSFGPIEAYARDFQKGSLKWTKGEAGKQELARAVHALVSARRPVCDRALYSILRPGHWGRGTLRDFLMVPCYGPLVWLCGSHPFAVRLVAEELDNKTPTGGVWSRDDDNVMLVVSNSGTAEWFNLHAQQSGLKGWRTEAKELGRDRAAWLLSRGVVGMPFYSPLLKDAYARRAAIKKIVERWQDHLRPASAAEAKAVDVLYDVLVPDIRPLGRVATEADVKARRAVFHLGGKGKMSKRKLPAVAELNGEKGIVVQAEIAPDGKEVFGVITRYAVRRVEAKDVLAVRPLKE
jgi:hypothetical protein